MKKIMQFFKVYLQALLLAIFSFTLGILLSKCRFLFYKICYHFGLNTGIYKKRIPVVSITDIVPNRQNIEMIHAINTDGDISIYELITINLLVAHFKPTQIFEFGTYQGRTTVNMLLNSPQNASVHTIDLPADNMNDVSLQLDSGETQYIQKATVGKYIHLCKEKNRITQLLGDTGKFDFSPYHNQMDLVFIDASHTEQYVKNDTEIAFKLIKKGGVLIWHDYGQWDGVTKVLNRYFQNNAACKNMKAIDKTSMVFLKTEQ